MASGLFDLDLRGGALIKIGCNGLSNCFCVGAIWHREYNFTGIVVTSLKYLSFKERDRGNYLFCQGKNAPHDSFLGLFFICNFLTGHYWQIIALLGGNSPVFDTKMEWKHGNLVGPS
jgi:hypothetical protein